MPIRGQDWVPIDSRGASVISSKILTRLSCRAASSRSSRVPRPSDHSLPQILKLTVDLHKTFFGLPATVARPQPRNPTFSDLRGDIGPNRSHQNRTVS